MTTDNFTNILLVILITLLGFIGKVFYEKITEVYRKIEGILLSHLGAAKDIDQLKEDVDEHEERITYLENTKR